MNDAESPTPTDTVPRDLAWTAGLVTVALALRIAFVLKYPAAPAWDGELYERGARAIGRGMGYVTFMFPRRSSDTVPTAFYPVGYPAFIGACYALFGASLRVLHVAGAVVSAATVGFAHRLAWRVSPGWPARLAGAAVALMPGQILFAGAAMTEPLFHLLIAAFVYALVARRDGARALDLVCAGVVLALATYVRPQAIVLAPVIPLLRPLAASPSRAAAIESARSGIRRRLLSAAVVTVTALVLVLPWTLRNCARLDGCAFVSTNGGSNLAIGAVPRATGTFMFLAPADGCRRVTGEVNRDQCWRRVALGAIRHDPVRWLRLALTKLDHTLSYESFPVSYLRESRAWSLTDAQEAQWRRWLTAYWKAMLILAVFAVLPIGLRARLEGATLVCAASIVVLLSTHVIFFGGDRYHLPLVALFAALSAGAFRGLAAPIAWVAVKNHARKPA